MNDHTIRTSKSQAPGAELQARREFLELFRACPIPDDEFMANLGLFLRRHEWSRMLFLDSLYRQILEVPGAILEFGTRWGQNLALFASLRGMYEPYHIGRRIVGFDTFSGFPAVCPKDGQASSVSVGGYGVSQDYEAYLDKVLNYHQGISPLPHIDRIELVKGDVSQTFPAHLNRHPETIVALAYFDMDLYQPTKDCLERLRPRLTKGSVLGFDQLNRAEFPGETLALAEVFGLGKLRLRKSVHEPYACYCVVD